jgi:predicted NAD/FAD-dependent oxidoreductase
MLAFTEPLQLEFDGAFVHDPNLAWVARNSSKPGRESIDCWVLHATAGWSMAHVDMAPDAVISHLSASFSQAAGSPLPKPVFSAAHRWRFAQAQKPMMTGCLWDRSSMIGICGDWCYGARIEGAFLSGAAAAGRLLSL